MDILSFILGYIKGKSQGGGGNADADTDAINDRLDAILGEVVGENQYTVTFVGADGSTLCTVLVTEGDDCADPVSTNLISKPTKASTAQYTYTYWGWSLTDGGAVDANALKAITADKTLYARFMAVERKYTVRFYDGETLLNTESIAYGGSSTYTYKKENHIFNGWLPEPTNISSDMDCYAQLEESYAFADASWEYIADISARGLASTAFAVGDTKDVEITLAGTAYALPVQIVGFNHDDLADGSGKAGISITTVPIISTYTLMYTHTGTSDPDLQRGIANDMLYTWQYHAIREALNNTILSCLQAELRSVIKTVSKPSFNSNHEIITTSDQLWLLSGDELGANGSDKPATFRGDGTVYEYFDLKKNEVEKRRIRTVWDAIPDEGGSRHGTRTHQMSYWTTVFNSNTGEWDDQASKNPGTRFHLVGFCV